MIPASVTILGGTGTLGTALVKEMSTFWPDTEITIVSRDEHKQAAMKRSFPLCKYAIGDIRSASDIGKYINNRDVVFHVAALKHVDIMEANPLECLKTNLMGTMGVADVASIYGVKNFVFSSTDKAVDPINTYGYAKALAEKYLFNKNLEQSNTKMSVYRWGNVLGSNGSVIPLFAKTLKESKCAYVTDTEMTRFWIPIELAVKYMILTYREACSDMAMVPPTMKSASVLEIVDAIADVIGVEDYRIIKTGLRAGEKMHEVLFSQWDERHISSNTSPKYTHDELVNMLEPLLKEFK